MSTPTMLQLLERREQICIAIKEIKTMRRGTLNEVFRYQELKSGEIAQRGPFYNITTKTQKKTVTTAVPKEDVERVRQEVENCHIFRKLSDEYIEVCEKIALLTTSEDDEAKKN